MVGLDSKYAILLCMNPPRNYWRQWAVTLRRFQLTEFIHVILEAAAPMTSLGAQAIYFGSSLFPNDQLRALANMLDDPNETHAFADYLSGESKP